MSSQTNPATRTVLAYQEGDLSADQLFALIDLHNELVEDTHDFTAAMDLDGGITDTDYEATLTAAEIDHSGYTTAVASPAPVKGLFGQFPVGVVTEELAQVFTEQLDNAIADFSAIVAKLNLDAGVAATNFDTAIKTNNRLVMRLTAANAVAAQDGINCFCRIQEKGHGHGGFLLAAGTPDTGVTPRLMRSLDDGRSWHYWSHFGSSITAIKGIVQVGERLFLFCNTAAAALMYVSDDFGKTWEGSAPAVTSTVFTDALVIPNSDVILAAGSDAGEILRSADGGVTWSVVTVTGPTTINSLGYSPTTGKVFACGDDAILYSSDDDGATFAAEEDFSGGNPDNCIAFLELSNGYWLVTTHDGDGVDELQVSKDAGDTWEAPLAVAGAQDELGKMIQGPDGTVYIAVGADVQVSYDNGTTVESAATGVIFPANDTAISAFGKTRLGEVIVGSTNATDFAGLWLLGTQLPKDADAYGEATTGGGPLLDQYGGGVSGRWLSWVRQSLTRLIECWQAFGAMMDDDVSIAGTAYEAKIAGKILTKAVTDPDFTNHNAGHGAGA